VRKPTPSARSKTGEIAGVTCLDGEAAGIYATAGNTWLWIRIRITLYWKTPRVTGGFITLGGADVHDRRESSSMNEKYVLESKKYGVRSNRREVHIRFQRMVSYSLLENVIDY